MLRWTAILTVLMLAACAGPGQGSGCPPCPSSDTCIKGGTCALSCSPDAGNPCPSGQTCQQTSGYCTGTGCSAVLVWVCLPQ